MYTRGGWVKTFKKGILQVVMKTLVIDGKEFLKAAVAAKEHGYTNDYIGQLCRGGKVEAKLVGRTWYVSVESLLKHRKSRYRSNQKKTKEELKKVLSETNPKSEQDTPQFYKRIVPATEVQYTNDIEELIPSPKKIIVETEEIRGTEGPEAMEDVQNLPVKELETETAAEYFANTVYDEKPKSGVLQIVEDISEAPEPDSESTANDVAVRLVKTNRRRVVHSRPISHQVARVKVPQKAQTEAPDHNLVPAQQNSLGIIAPLSVSLLAGLAIAMLMVGLSWQFESSEGSYSETYRVQVSSLIQH